MFQEKFSVFEINQTSEVADPRLGFPNLSNECTTCGGKGSKDCEGSMFNHIFYFYINTFVVSQVNS